ncbi:MAG: apolipoprotein N-acyltransferase [Methylococcaceae bacterium]|nr:apolipoprotein N-acyltransferase [Methylococcaceae bacterium]
MTNREPDNIPTISWVDLAALTAGILYTLAFAPFNQSYLALLALCIVFTSWRKATPGRAILRGYLFGLGAFGLGVSWVFVSMHDFGGANLFISGLLTALFVAFWSMFPALTGYLAVKLTPDPATRILGLPSIWVLMDYFRGQMVLNGFPWLLCAYSQLETPLAGYVPIVGVYGTGFLLALSASILVTAAFDRQRRIFLSLLLITLWGTGYYLQSIAWTHVIGNPLRISLIQGSVSQDQKWLPENRQKTLQLYQSMTEAHWDSAIIVWPETAIPAYLSEVQDYFLLPLSRTAQQHGTDLVISVPTHGDTEDEKYNAVITLGKKSGSYRKDHLLPFGEYLPWQPISGFILNKLNMRLGIFTPGGANQPLLEAGGYPFITSICYEDAFGDKAIRDLADAAFLVNVTNDGWFGDSIEPHQHLQIARMRALETGRFLLRSTNTGATAIVGPDGGIITRIPLFKSGVLTGFISPMAGITPYAKIGDKPALLLMALLVSGTYFWGYQGRKKAV